MATAPMFSDVVLSDPDEMMKVTNVGSVPLEWAGVRRVYVLEPKKTVFIPFHVCCKYLGDPRSEFKKQTVFQTPNGERGVVPERKGELIRLSVFYGLYHDKLNMLPKVAPKVSVYTLTDRELTFPISNPDSINYGDFAVAMNDGASASAIMIIDVPASYHNGAGGISFADGHAEIHKWRDSRTIVPITGNYMSSSVRASPGNRDMIYMSEHASMRQ